MFFWKRERVVAVNLLLHTMEKPAFGYLCLILSVSHPASHAHSLTSCSTLNKAIRASENTLLLSFLFPPNLLSLSKADCVFSFPYCFLISQTFCLSLRQAMCMRIRVCVWERYYLIKLPCTPCLYMSIIQSPDYCSVNQIKATFALPPPSSVHSVFHSLDIFQLFRMFLVHPGDIWYPGDHCEI